MKQVVLIVVLTAAALCVAPGQMKARNETSTAEQEVRQVHRSRLQALVSADLNRLDKILADDLIYISPIGKVQTKAEIVSDLKSGALRVSSIEQGEPGVRVYGDAAVVVYLTTSKFSDNGKEYNNEIRATSVYVRRDGRWQLVSQQLTRVAAQ